MSKADNITVEVAYALPQQQIDYSVASIHQKLRPKPQLKLSGILTKFPEIDLEVNQIGIFGKLIKLNTPLRHLDRVEIYRPLIADPKEVRKQRAADGKAMKKGGGDSPSEGE